MWEIITEAASQLGKVSFTLSQVQSETLSENQIWLDVCLSDVLLSTAQADNLLLSLGTQIETFVTFHLSRHPNVAHY